MKISLNWLKEYIKLEESPEEIGNILTQAGLEVEGIEKFEAVPGGLKGLVIGKVLTCTKHPNADKLSVTTVDIGDGEATPIVCGAPNVAEGQKVIVATVGTMLYPAPDESFKIKKAKIRGEVSEGMICAEDEIGMGVSHDGIMVLDTDMPVGTLAAQYFNLQADYVFEIGLTPNRSDATSHIGTARDLKAVMGREINGPSIDAFKTDNTDRKIEVVVENQEACPRYSGVTISGVTIAESPDWLKQKLLSIGLAPINNLVDITNFVLHEVGQPLHAFDADLIKGNKVVVKTLPEGSVFTTLDEKERKLKAEDLMICDGEGNGMCIAGVFGGIKSGVTNATKNIFLESAYFSADYVRKTSMAHGLKTDASFRFERGTDPNATVFALKRAALLIKELCGGTISSEIVDVYPNEIKELEVDVKYKNVDRLIGKKLDHERIISILESLDFKVKEKTAEGFKAIVPTYRVEVTREADIIEEILRIYGFNNVEIPEFFSSEFLSEFPEIDREKTQFRTAEMLVSQGFYEIMANSLTKPSYVSSLKELDENKNVIILNKLSEDLGVLRQTLLFSGLEAIAYNVNRKQKNLRFFEFGNTYFKKEKGYDEHERLAILMTGDIEGENWNNKVRQLEFHDLSSIVQKILNKFNISKFASRPVQQSTYEYGLEAVVNDKVIVTFGMVSEEAKSVIGVSQSVFFADFDWDFLLKNSQKKIVYKELSKFPEVQRDLSLVIDKSVSFEEIREVAEKMERKILKEISVFDVYVGDRIGNDKKAYALKFLLQDQHKTLNDKAIDKTMSRLMRSFEEELGAIIRK